MKITCYECGNEINWWETTGFEDKLITCPCCDMKKESEKDEPCKCSTH